MKSSVRLAKSSQNPERFFPRWRKILTGTLEYKINLQKVFLEQRLIVQVSFSLASNLLLFFQRIGIFIPSNTIKGVKFFRASNTFLP